MSDEYYESQIGGKEMSLKEKVDLLLEEKREKEKKLYKERKFKLPSKAKVSKTKSMKGYITVMTIKDNRTVDFVRKQIIGNTIKLTEGEPLSISALKSEDLFLYKGKPLLIQPKSHLNPWNPLTEKNETYGQALVMARMEGDKLITKKGFGKLGWVFGAVVLAIIAYSFITGA